MKEATGEANMTIVTIVLIAVIVAVVTPLINNMLSKSEQKATCTAEGKCWKGSNGCQPC